MLFLLIPLIGLVIYASMRSARAEKINEQATEIVAVSRETYASTHKTLEAARKDASAALTSLDKMRTTILRGELSLFAKCYSKIQRYAIRRVTKEAALRSHRTSAKAAEGKGVIKSASASVPAVIGVGAVSVFSAYNHAPMIGRASTGTPIAFLKGSAARNARLAWLGGGSLDSGGYGMAGGLATLAAVGLGTVFATTCLSELERAEQNLERAKKHAKRVAQDIKTMTAMTATFLRITDIASQAQITIAERLPVVRTAIHDLDALVEKRRNALPEWRHTLEATLGAWTGLTRVPLYAFPEGEQAKILRAVAIGEALLMVAQTPVVVRSKGGKVNSAFCAAISALEQMT